MRTLSYIADGECAGKPLWFVLEERLHISHVGVRRAKRVPGAVLLDGVPARVTQILELGQRVEICIGDEVAQHGSRIEPQPGPLEVCYEDDDILIVNKPAGQVVHPCSGKRDRTLANHVAWHLQAQAAEKPSEWPVVHPIHRLDGGTSGLVVFCTTGHAQTILQSQMHTGEFERRYLALCHGAFDAGSGTVTAPIGRAGKGPSSHAVTPDGKHAVTHWRVVREIRKEDGVASLVELVLETGRTHQIRLHMAHLGHPLLGDAAYGDPQADAALGNPLVRAALHSWRISLVHPLTGKRLKVEAPLPEDMAGFVGTGDNTNADAQV